MIGDEIYVWSGYPNGWQSTSAPQSLGGFVREGNVYIPVPPPTVDTSVPQSQASARVTSGAMGTAIPSAVPGVVSNTIFEGVGPSSTSVITSDNALSALKAWAEGVYGSDELGVIRQSSEVLENEPTGIRPGTMERIVLPAWARRQRGSPL